MIALVILVVLTLLGMAAMSGNLLQQKMAYGAAQTNLAFQSAESALAAGEFWLESQVDRPVAASCDVDCPAGTTVRRASEPETSPIIRDQGWWLQQGIVPVQVKADVGEPPRYVIEELGRGSGASIVLGGPKSVTLWYYRVTARGTGSQADGPPALVQSVYTKGFK